MPASIEKARAECDALSKALTTWPSWFFARGDLAAGGAGDESPLVFDDTTLNAATTRAYTYPLGRAPGGRGPAPAPGPTTVYLTFASLNPTPGVAPVVVWRNPRIVTARRLQAPLPGRDGRRPLAQAPGARSCRPHRCAPCCRPTTSRALKFGASPTARPSGPTTSRRRNRLVHDPGRCRRHGLPSSRSTPSSASDRERRDPRDALGPARSRPATPTSASSSAIRRAPATRRSAPGSPSTSRCCRRTRTAKPNPADKDPVPPPFDNTYNSPEHDAFVLKVKYQRNDRSSPTTSSMAPIARGSTRHGTICSGRGRITMPISACSIDHYGLTLPSAPRRRADAGADRRAAGGGAAARRGAARALRRRDAGDDSQASPATSTMR